MYIVFKFEETFPEKNEGALFEFAVLSNELDLLEMPYFIDKLPLGAEVNKRSSNEPVFNYYIDANTNDSKALEKLLNEFKLEFHKYKNSSQSYTSPDRHPAVQRITNKLSQLPGLFTRIKQTLTPYATNTNLLFAGMAAGAVLLAAAQYYKKSD